MNNNFNWSNNKPNRKNIIIISITVLIILLISSIIYDNKFSKNDILSDQDYIRAKEEYQKELKQKKENYSIKDKISFNEKISVTIINSSMRSTGVNSYSAPPFALLNSNLKKHNSQSSINEINSPIISNIVNLVSNGNGNLDSTNFIKESDLIIVCYNKSFDNTNSSDFKDLLTKLHNDTNTNTKIILCIESGTNEDNIKNLNAYSKDYNYSFLDMREALDSAKKSDIQIIRNNIQSSSNVCNTFCNEIWNELH